MGNCLGTCFGSIRRKSKVNYFGGRYKEYNVGIEFESLIEDDLVQQSERAAITDSERDHLLNKRYSDLVKDQKRRDAEIDSELKKQEENIRLEEEAYIAAKRESARAALQTRAREPRRSRPVANGTAKSSWLGDNESEWNVLWEKTSYEPSHGLRKSELKKKAGADEDDFETFLESVKARSQSVRANDDDSDIEWP
ncbi:AP-1 complex-associated regulatory protein-like isoform X3 [Acanthaster planci]|uniref:AP-1 complex-associated regulatory protein-like isoform X3 n=1 Tax=Acanthaster planci TaxID=133434 RepID=A0A8B7XGF1_ACAPL|nr:AP-1 complex-associated regulatory protein-like isoform X3 [Acanthaster planci]